MLKIAIIIGSTYQTREQLKDPEWASAMLGKTLFGRLGRPEEVANVAVFLTSDDVVKPYYALTYEILRSLRTR